jgi:hypothetical protein
MCSRVPRLVEAAQHVRDPEIAYERDGAAFSVRDDGGFAGGLDAARRGERCHEAEDAPGGEIYGDEPRLLVGGHQHDG